MPEETRLPIFRPDWSLPAIPKAEVQSMIDTEVGVVADGLPGMIDARAGALIDTAGLSIDQALDAAARAETAMQQAEAISGIPSEDGAVAYLLGDQESLTRAALGGAVDAHLAATVRAAQGIVEYPWIIPQVSYADGPHRHTVISALGDTSAGQAPLLAIEVNHDTNSVTTTQYGSVDADDHNVPAIVDHPGERIFAQWTRHNLDSILRFRVGMAGDVASLAGTTVQSIDVGAATSYGQIWRLSSSTQALVDYLLLYRRGVTEWYALTVRVNQATGIVSALNNPGVHLVSGDGLQCYVTTAAGYANTIRVAFGTNPSSSSTWVQYFEIDLTTGAITTPVDDNFAANLDGTGLPITPQTFPALVPNLPGGQARRLLEVRAAPARPAILTCEWTNPTSSGTARYKVQEWFGDLSPEDIGDAAGFDGLSVPAGGPAGAISYDAPLAQGATALTVTADITLPASAPSRDWLDVCEQYTGGRGWQLRIGGNTAARQPRLIVSRGTGSETSTLTCPAPLPVAWGERIMLRATYTVALSDGNRLHWHYSTDGGTTWTHLGAHVGNAGAIDITPGIHTTIGTRATDRAAGQVIHSASATTNNGDLFAVNFAVGWPGYATTYTDPDTHQWSLYGAAIVGRTAVGPVIPPAPLPDAKDYGPAGPSIWASYFPGACFDTVSGDVIAARQTSGQEQLALMRTRSRNSPVTEQIILAQPSSQGRVMRPLAPRDGGPLRAAFSRVTSYPNEYYEWTAAMAAIRR